MILCYYIVCMILKTFQHSLGHHSLIEDLVSVLRGHCSTIPTGVGFFLGIKSVTTKWEEVIPFLFEPSDFDDAIACIRAWQSRIKGGRFLPACTHECVIYYVDCATIDRHTSGESVGDLPDDPIFVALMQTMMRMQEAEAQETIRG